jgi:hypothetical protein
MKKLLSLALLLHLGCAQALGPGEISFNGIKYFKSNEKFNGTSISAEYMPTSRTRGESIVITHVLDKNEPSTVVKSLKGKKSVEIVEVANINKADALVSFIKFDLPNLKVQNNMARIKTAANGKGSVVFQYIETQRLQNQSEGSTFPDFSSIAENIKQIPIEHYTSSGYSGYSRSFDRGNQNLPWYKRPNARAGQGAFFR